MRRPGTRRSAGTTRPLAQAALALRAVVGLALGLALGCLVSLDHHRACGDGHIDLEAGEACDPGAAMATWACGDPGLPVACGSATCTCSTCGNGVVEGDEECDGGVGEARCSDGSNGLTCTACRLDTSACSTCGNGSVDEGEECDDEKDGDNDDGCTDACREPACGDGWVQRQLGEQCDDGRNGDNVGDGCTDQCMFPDCHDGWVQGDEECDVIGSDDDIVAPRDCSEIPSHGPEPYTSGTYSRCQECRFDRSGCGYCGNGRRDMGRIDGDGTIGLNEVCDGPDPEQFDLDAYKSFCRQACTDQPLANITLECNAECRGDCRGFVDDEDKLSIDELGCCIPLGFKCPAEEYPQFPCCPSPT